MIRAKERRFENGKEEGRERNIRKRKRKKEERERELDKQNKWKKAFNCLSPV